MAVRVNSEQFARELKESTVPLLVEFYSDSCIPCKQLSPILGDLEEAYAEQIKIVKVNVNFEQELAAQYEILASPTILFFQGGEEKKRIRGLVKKPELENAVKEILEG